MGKKLNRIYFGGLIVKLTRTTVACAFGVFLMLSGKPFARESVADTRIAATDEGDFEDDEDEGEIDGTPQERIDKLRSWLEQRNREREDAEATGSEPTQETEELSAPRRQYVLEPNYEPERRYEPEQTWERTIFPYSRHVARRHSHDHRHHTAHASHSRHAHNKHDKHGASSRGHATHERTVHGHVSHEHKAHEHATSAKSTLRNSGKGKAQHASLQKPAKSASLQKPAKSASLQKPAKSGVKQPKPSTSKSHSGSGKRRK
jgi:hypothetical protein